MDDFSYQEFVTDVIKEIYCLSSDNSKDFLNKKIDFAFSKIKKVDLYLVKSWIYLSFSFKNEDYFDSLEDFLISNVFNVEILSFYIYKRFSHGLSNQRILDKIIKNSYRYFKADEILKLISDVRKFLSYEDFRKIELILVEHSRVDLLLVFAKNLIEFNKKIIFAELLIRQTKQNWLTLYVNMFLREFPELQKLLIIR